MLKPTTPLRPLIQASMKPSSPPPAPEQHPLKPTTPLRPKNAPKTPGSHPQRRWQFQPTHLAGPQRRHRFQTTAPRAATCPLLRKLARNSIGPAPQQHSETLKYQRKQFNFRNSLRGITCDINDLACGPGRASRRRADQRPSPTGVEGAGGSGGPGCGARGRRRGLAGLRDDAPSL